VAAHERLTTPPKANARQGPRIPTQNVAIISVPKVDTKFHSKLYVHSGAISADESDAKYDVISDIFLALSDHVP
jgi:hypothetical protein